MNGRIFLSGRDQDGAAGHLGETVVRVIVAIGIEQEPIGVRLLTKGADESGRIGPVAHHPLVLVDGGMRISEDDIGIERELTLGPRSLHRVASDRNAIFFRRPLGEMVLPITVVEGAGGHDVDPMPPRQPLRHPAGVRLRPPGNRVTVALDYKGQIH